MFLIKVALSAIDDVSCVWRNLFWDNSYSVWVVSLCRYSFKPWIVDVRKMVRTSDVKDTSGL